MLSSKLSVGVHILTLLAIKAGEPMTSAFIACSVNTNPVVIRRLLGLFREAGFVESKNGAGGGWLLVRDPKKITLVDVLAPSSRKTRCLPCTGPGRMKNVRWDIAFKVS